MKSDQGVPSQFGLLELVTKGLCLRVGGFTLNVFLAFRVRDGGSGRGSNERRS